MLRAIGPILALLLATSPASIPIPNPKPVSTTVGQPPRTAATNQNVTADNKNGLPKSALVRAIASIPRDKNPADSEKRSENQINKKIAGWTKWSALGAWALFFAAIAQAGLFVWQLLLIRGSLADAKEAADAAKIAANAAQSQAKTLDESLKLTKEATAKELRAYITAEGTPWGIAINSTFNDKTGDYIIVNVELRNVGSTPALKTALNSRGVEAAHEKAPEVPSFGYEGQGADIGPKGKLVPLPWAYSFDTICNAYDEKIDLYFFVRADFFDAFSTDPRHVQYAFRVEIHRDPKEWFYDDPAQRGPVVALSIDSRYSSSN